MPKRAIASPTRRCCPHAAARFLRIVASEALPELDVEIRPTAVEHVVHAREQRATSQPNRRAVPVARVGDDVAAAVAQLSHDRELRLVPFAQSDEGDFR